MNVLAFVYLAALIAGPAQAQCAPASAQAVLDCALKNHPLIRRAAAEEAQAAYLEPAALQRPNPELDATGLFGRRDGEGLNRDDVSLLHTIEAGGKRDARGEAARAQRGVVESSARKTREDVAKDSVAALYRLRQAKAEGAILDKTIASLQTVQQRLTARPRLTPDQEATLEVFRLAESESRLRRSGLTGEVRALERWLAFATGGVFESRPELLPPLKTDWPALPDQTVGDLSGSEALRARADVAAAAAGVSSARGAAYPDVRVGPAMERETEGPILKQTYGVSLVLPLPLYQRNRAGKQYAELGVLAARAGADAATGSLATERRAELERYRAAVEALRSVAAEAGAATDVRKTEELFRRGLIPSSFLLEAYRQSFEMTKSRDEAELSAVRSLWRIYAIEGSILTEKL